MGCGGLRVPLSTVCIIARSSVQSPITLGFFFVILQAQTLEVKTAWVTEITRLLWKQAMRSKGTCFLTKHHCVSSEITFSLKEKSVVKTP